MSALRSTYCSSFLEGYKVSSPSRVGRLQDGHDGVGLPGVDLAPDGRHAHVTGHGPPLQREVGVVGGRLHGHAPGGVILNVRLCMHVCTDSQRVLIRLTSTILNIFMNHFSELKA